MRRRQESMKDRFHRFRGVILVISVPLLLLGVVLLMMPRSAPLETYASSSTSFEKKTLPEFKLTAERYAVVFDAGSTGTRVHVYRFDEHMDLMEIDGEFELFEKVTPGLSAYKDDPKGAGESIRPLLEKALAVVPKDLQNKTPVRVAATAGLRLLSEAVAEELLDEVRHVLKEYPFRCGKDSVAIMDGADEGAFAWVTVNHLLGNTDKLVKDTVGIVDLGGGSVQMAYAVEEPVARSAPAGYIREVNGKGVRWNVYVHSYLGYGLMAARAAVLSAQISQEGHACLPAGYTGSYEYGGKTFEAIARALGGSFDECSTSALAALKLDAPCDVDECSFNGVWHGGGGDGTHKLYIASYFFDRAQQLGIIPEAATDVAVIKPSDFGKAAEAICRLTLPEIAAKYKHVSETDAPFACLDIAYQATLLTKGFTIETDRSITLVKTVKYHGRDVEAAWPLGAAIDIMSV